MKAVGMIVEYNPFHNGHQYHLQQALEHTNADLAIAVMSGDFLQRGEPALINKWARTRMALHAGVDIVIELPTLYAVQKADLFAEAAVTLLDAIGCTSIAFGSEDGRIDTIWQAVKLLQENEEQYQLHVKKSMAKGYHYPYATSLAFQSLQQQKDKLDLSRPNNTLGFHYVEKIIEKKLSIEPITFPRKVAEHDHELLTFPIASASSIRKALFSNQQINQTIPDFVEKELFTYQANYGLFHQWENYWSFLRYKLLSSTPEQLQQIYEIKEGIENRLLSAATQAYNFHDFLEKVKTKRYTWTRLQRICSYILLNLTKERLYQQPTPSYLRLLGFSEKGRIFLQQNKKNFQLPLIAKASSCHEVSFLFNLKASEIYHAILDFNQQQKARRAEFGAPIQIGS